jgi:glyoxylase-like metal-dependent hydrolase (beta-lactamase superfamily II)
MRSFAAPQGPPRREGLDRRAATGCDRAMVFRLALAALCLAAVPPAGAQTPRAEPVAPGVHLLRGAMLPERGPDGNTVVFDAPHGLVIVDTGRHAWHSDAILVFAAARGRSVAAIVNTHWHLDHSSGNRRIKARFPEAPVVTTNAVDRALAEGGFITREQTRAEARRDKVGGAEAEELRVFLDTMAVRDSLRPDRVVSRDGPLRLAGRRFEAHVTDGAVTDADLWLFDRRTRVAVLGDLVTLPSAFFETACPERWRAALDAVWATPFKVAIPGHGAPMDRAAFDLYRRAFNAFLDCVASTAQAPVCAAAWTQAVASLEGVDRSEADAYARYYVDFLRRNGGRSPDCLDR